MKQNGPVTQREVTFPVGETIVSRTNLKGVITHVNQSFVDISGYSEAELIGHQHNILRHPDMPAAAFQDLWDTLKAGKPWTGMVKNRCKNGDHYWVRANIVPVTRNSETVEYLSVRTAPNREEIAEAESLYQNIKKGIATLETGKHKRPEFTVFQKFFVLNAIASALLLLLSVGLASFSLTAFFISEILLLSVSGLSYRIIKQQHIDPIEATTRLLHDITEGDYRKAIDLNRDDAIGKLLRAIHIMQIKLGYDIDDAKYRNQATMLFKHALDVCNTCVILVDNRGTVTYANDGFNTLLSTWQGTESQDIPQIDGGIIGCNIGILLPSIANQTLALDELNKSTKTQELVGSRTVKLVLTPVFDQLLTRIGTVIEWDDITEALRNEKIAQKIAEENATVRCALDVCDTSVTLTDKSLAITYLNQSAQNLFLNNETTLQQVLAEFDAKNILGMPVDTLLTNNKPELEVIRELSAPYHSQIRLSDRTFTITATPVYLENNRLGTVIEWKDITEQLEKRQQEKQIAEENRRVRVALDGASANVMVADNNFQLIYCNESACKLMRNKTADFREAIADFDPETVIGSSINRFLLDPGHQRQLQTNLDTSIKRSITVGKCHLDVTTTPIFDRDASRIGTVVEWIDRTVEVATEKEIDSIVEAAAAGDLSRRVSLLNKEGFFESLTWKLNGLQDNVERIIREAASVLRALADGDLSQKISGSYKGVFAQLQNDSNAMSSKLTQVIQDISTSANAVSNAAGEIATGTQDLSQRTEEQASALEETASSMEQMTSSVKHNAEKAASSAALSQDAQKISEQGGSILQETIASMEAISHSSSKITNIIGVIDEIAFQTNLLALNAAVEAARAGEHGRGFAVVAAEVRNLAQRSSSSAGEIKTLIKDSSDKVAEGSDLVHRSGKALQEIVQAVQELAAVIKGISESANEQNNGIAQVNIAINQMDEMTQQNAALVEEASAASESMREQAAEMLQLVQFFQLRKNGDQSVELPGQSAKKPELRRLSSRQNNTLDLANEDDWEDF